MKVILGIVHDTEEQFKFVWVDSAWKVESKARSGANSRRGLKDDLEVDRFMSEEVFVDAKAYGFG